MIAIRFHQQFIKQYKKLRPVRRKIDARLALFQEDPFNVLLNNHALTGQYQGYRSINITGDYRALYEPIDSTIAFFITVDTQSNLYR